MNEPVPNDESKKPNGPVSQREIAPARPLTRRRAITAVASLGLSALMLSAGAAMIGAAGVARADDPNCGYDDGNGGCTKDASCGDPVPHAGTTRDNRCGANSSSQGVYPDSECNATRGDGTGTTYDKHCGSPTGSPAVIDVDNNCSQPVPGVAWKDEDGACGKTFAGPPPIPGDISCGMPIDSTMDPSHDGPG